MDRAAFENDVRAYVGALPGLLPTSTGKFALVAHASLRGVFDSYEAALAEGVRVFGSDGFLAQKIVETDLTSGRRWLASCQP